MLDRQAELQQNQNSLKERRGLQHFTRFNSCTTHYLPFSSILCVYIPFLADENNSIQAAIARTATRSIALYFSRPVRLFRPAKGKQSAKV